MEIMLFQMEAITLHFKTLFLGSSSLNQEVPSAGMETLRKEI